MHPELGQGSAGTAYLQLHVMSTRAVKCKVASRPASQPGWRTWLCAGWLAWLGSPHRGFRCHHQLGCLVLLPLSTWFLCDLSSKVAELLTWRSSASKSAKVEAVRPSGLGLTLPRHHFYCKLKQVTGTAQTQGVENKKDVNVRRHEPSMQ